MLDFNEFYAFFCLFRIRPECRRSTKPKIKTKTSIRINTRINVPINTPNGGRNEPERGIFNVSRNENQMEWLEPVSDDEYRSAVSNP